MKIRLIYNPMSKKAKSAYALFLDLGLKKLADNGRNEIELVKTRAPLDATNLAREAVDLGFDMVVAIGGDGTLNEVINGVIGSDIIVGVIPFGITNVFALEVGIPRDPFDAIDILLHGRPRKIDVGKANDRYFILMVGAGLDGVAVNNFPFKLKWFLGRLSYIFTGAYYYFTRYTPSKMDILVDGKRFYGYQVMVNNVSLYGGKLKIAPNASIFDGLLDICIFTRSGLFDDLRYLWSILNSNHHRWSDVILIKGKEVEITGDSFFHVDSEPMGKLPVSIRIVPRAVKIMLPSRM